MKPIAQAILVTVIFSVIGVVGDYFLKLASLQKSPYRSAHFVIGFCLYASTALGWVFVMKHLKLATLSGVYSVTMILLLTGMGVVAFKERLTVSEILGLGMAVGSLFLLTRFAG